MYKKISLKIRILILSIFCIIGILILVYTAIENKNLKQFKNGINNSKIKKTESMKAENKASKNEIQTIKDEKQKQIDSLTEKGYNDFGAKNYKFAIDEENQAIALDDNNSRAHAVKGIALCYSQLNETNFQSGLQEIDRALQIKPDYGYARFNRALALELYGHYDEALIWYDKALEVDNFVWSYYGKACIYGRKGDVENSVKYLKIAIGMQANIKEEARAEEDFANVRDSEAFKELLK
jgi:tetratricopeptide (TPR) repeat protein